MAGPGQRRRVVILGAGGRDFHNFNMVYRADPGFEVVAFGAAQIPGIEDRRYPPSLAGALYPDGIPILAEDDLPDFCAREKIHEVVFAYSDIAHGEVMHKASRFLAAGADFTFLGPDATMLAAGRPVIAVTAVRTGCGKSAVSRHVAALLRQRDLRVAVLRHPMPYGDLERQSVQRFATMKDLDAADCTIEEREEYEPYVAAGNVIYAGVDYGAILGAAEQEADVVLWDGGNNDFPFVRPDLHIVLADALRPGDEGGFHPGETVLRMADQVLIMKVADAPAEDVSAIEQAARAANPGAGIIRGDLAVSIENGTALRGKTVLVVEDGPTITHGGMAHGAGLIAALQAGVGDIVDPRATAAPEIAKTYQRYPHIGPVLPAVGYYGEQLKALAETIENTPADAVVLGTPARIEQLVDIGKPVYRAVYEYAETQSPGLDAVIDRFAAGIVKARTGAG